MPVSTGTALRWLRKKEQRLEGEILSLEQNFRAEIMAPAGAKHSSDPTDMACTGYANSSARHSQINQLRRALDKVRRVIRGIENKTLDYGICEECGNEIPDDRLKIYPETTLCVPCKQEEERKTKRMSQFQNGRLTAAVF